ncbi:nucleotide sugar dehydrogenase [Pseudohaliea rubra]|uniref:UDP-glucose dehydrogenase n=1 Tax=Pseudohaliea rubra DSM 19751 TaxID=1265313 RepID=A0A095VNX5_9GAMM|nr:nucleotide sugar dehydrogenase [Pseudohaliea rubra]KGE02823.1 UDP-glucose dehydrogenase [Pseudohaliea rubra DSM 19751]
MSPQEALLEKIEDRSASIAVVGLGYVGLPLLLRFAEAGFPVLGLDSDPEKPAALARGESYFTHIPAERVRAAHGPGFVVTTDYGAADRADALILCVPTPLTQHREPDLSYVTATLSSLLPQLRPGQVLCLESTTYPGTTEEILLPRLQEQGFSIGEDFFLVYSPEREDPGNTSFSTRSIPKIISGQTPACLAVAKALYGAAVDRVVPMTSPRAAEMTKLLENIHRAVNIGLVNEMKIVADRMGIDIFEVVEAAATKPFGFMPYFPGPGLGGHCIPIDPFYLTWKAREYGINTRFIELAGEVNSAMPEYVVSKLVAGLNVQGRALKGSRILVLGVAYKKNVDDMRESPAAAIMQLLDERGAEVAYSDPYVPVFPRMRRYRFDLASVPLTAESLAAFDAVVIATDHADFDYELVWRNARLIIDPRGVFRQPAAHLVRA